MGEHYGDALATHGFVHVASLGVGEQDIGRVGELLDALFERYDQLPQGAAHDLGGRSQPDEAAGDTLTAEVAPRVPEILDTSTLEPRLKDTAVYGAGLALARELLGPRAYLTYDHAIYKDPGRSAPTTWHQDSGYDQELTHGIAVWIPLQDTAEIDGCMRYVDASHLRGRTPHDLRVGADGKQILSLDVDPADATIVPCALGGAVVHDLHTIHGAGANDGMQVRRAWILNYSTTTPVRGALRSLRRAVRPARRQPDSPPASAPR